MCCIDRLKSEPETETFRHGEGGFVKFYELGPRQDYAGYSTVLPNGEIDDARIIPLHRQAAAVLEEYCGNPPRKPAKKGSIHISGSFYYARKDVLALLQTASSHQLLTKPTSILGRENEIFEQFWVLNFVDCLDLDKTIASQPGTIHKKFGKIGVIKRPVFDESRWDGSDLFVVPQDPSFRLYCTENFIAEWKARKLKGAKFSRFLFDPDAICS